MYRPEPVPSDAKAWSNWLDRQMRKIAEQLAAAVNFVVVNPSHAEPEKRTEGMIAVADGADWDPGAGAGVYAYVGGVWASGTVPVVLTVSRGGTGISSYAVGDMLYASGATTLSKLAGVATGNALLSGGVTTAPAWGKVGLTTHVSGTLPLANGGTNATDAAGARTSLGLGTIATQNANNVTITGGSVSGITDLAVADGGTGSSTAAGARTNLGATTLGANLFTLTNPGAVTFLRANADNTVTARSASETRTDLGVTATGSDTTYAYRANNLSDLASAATARTNLGVTATGADTAYAYRSNNLSDLASAATARTNLGATTVGGAFFTLSDPGAIRFPRANADNSVTLLSDSDMRTALGLGTAATVNTGTSGATIPLNNNSTNTVSGAWTFTNSDFTLSNSGPRFIIDESDQASGSRMWAHLVAGTRLSIRTYNDTAGVIGASLLNTFQITRGGDVAVNSAALATTATEGTLWLPSCAGTPTGAMTPPFTNAIPVMVDRTNRKICLLIGGVWYSSAAFT